MIYLIRIIIVQYRRDPYYINYNIDYSILYRYIAIYWPYWVYCCKYWYHRSFAIFRREKRVTSAVVSPCPFSVSRCLFALPPHGASVLAALAIFNMHGVRSPETYPPSSRTACFATEKKLPGFQTIYIGIRAFHVLLSQIHLRAVPW